MSAEAKNKSSSKRTKLKSCPCLGDKIEGERDLIEAKCEYREVVFITMIDFRF